MSTSSLDLVVHVFFEYLVNPNGELLICLNTDATSLHTEAKWKGFAVAQTFLEDLSIRENGRVQISDVKKVSPRSKKMYAKSGPFQKRLAFFRSI